MPEGSDPVTPSLFNASRTPLRDSIAQAITAELANVPDQTWEVSVLYNDGTVKASTAIRLARGRWALIGGAFVEKPEDAPADVGAFGKVSVTF